MINAPGITESAERPFDLERRGGTIALFGDDPERRSIPVSPFLISEDETHAAGLLEGLVTEVLPFEVLAAAMVLNILVAPGEIAIDLGAS